MQGIEEDQVDDLRSWDFHLVEHIDNYQAGETERGRLVERRESGD